MHVDLFGLSYDEYDQILIHNLNEGGQKFMFIEQKIDTNNFFLKRVAINFDRTNKIYFYSNS